MRTYVDRARTRVERERAVVAEKRDAYDRFRTRLESTHSQPRSEGIGETLVSSGASASRPIREAFVETIAPVCEDRPRAELLAAELGEEIACALTTDGPTPALQRAVRAEVDQRSDELAAMDRALDAEADSLERAGEALDPIRNWLLEENETSLSDCGFEALSERHARIAAFRTDCDDLVADRQTHLDRTTGAGGRAGLRHRDLIGYLYDGLPVGHPVLVTAVCMDDLCGECQRTLRDHLVRQV